MKDQVVMSKNNAEICVAIPLFRVHHQESLEKLGEYRIFLTKEKPTAYVLEHPEFGGSLKLFNADFIENNMEFLGELGDDEFDVLPDPNSTHDIGQTPEIKNNKGEDDGSSI